MKQGNEIIMLDCGQVTGAEIQDVGSGTTLTKNHVYDTPKLGAGEQESVGLGNPKYIPTQQEVDDTIINLSNTFAEFKYWLFLIYIHEMYKYPPYNCRTISEFIGKHLTISRATVYRVIVEISINYCIYGSYNWKSPKINSNICQKLNRILVIQGSQQLKNFWYELNDKFNEKLTAKVIEQQIFHMMRFNRFSDSETHKNDLKVPIHIKPQSIQSFEKKYIEDCPVEPDKEYFPYSSQENNLDEKPKLDDESDDAFDDESEKDYSEADYIVKSVINDIKYKSYGGVYTPKIAEAINLIVNLRSVELMTLNECIEQILSLRESTGVSS